MGSITSFENTAWKVSKYGVFSSPYIPVFGLNKGKYGPEKTHSIFGHFSHSEIYAFGKKKIAELISEQQINVSGYFESGKI